MKTFLKILAVVAAFVIAAQAQNNIYQQTTLVELAGAQRIAQAGNTTTVSVTNSTVDIHGFVGLASVVITVVSNTVGPAGFVPSVTTTIQSSSDNTNFTTISDAALSSRTSLSITNYAFALGTNATGVTDTYFAPTGDFTNSIVLSNQLSTVTEYGILPGSENRYLRVIFDIRGSNSIYGGSVVLRGRRSAPFTSP